MLKEHGMAQGDMQAWVMRWGAGVPGPMVFPEPSTAEKRALAEWFDAGGGDAFDRFAGRDFMPRHRRAVMCSTCREPWPCAHETQRLDSLLPYSWETPKQAWWREQRDWQEREVWERVFKAGESMETVATDWSRTRAWVDRVFIRITTPGERALWRFRNQARTRVQNAADRGVNHRYCRLCGAFIHGRDRWYCSRDHAERAGRLRMMADPIRHQKHRRSLAKATPRMRWLVDADIPPNRRYLCKGSLNADTLRQAQEYGWPVLDGLPAWMREWDGVPAKEKLEARRTCEDCDALTTGRRCQSCHIKWLATLNRERAQ